MLAPVPFFHVMGMIVLSRSIFWQRPIIRLPTDQPFNAASAIEAIKATKPGSAIFPPSVLEDMSATEEGMQALSTLKRVFYGGAPLSLECGNKISTVTPVIPVIGSTEAVIIASLHPSGVESEWSYFQWSAAAGIEMEPAESGLSEMVLKPKDIKYQPIFNNFPELQEWRTKDLFEPHPSKPNLWRYRGRRDDLLALSNGEKFNPVPTEKIVEGHPQLKGALVVGQGHFQAGLIIEPDWSTLPEGGEAALIESVWPLVEKANVEAPGHARIYKSKIAVSRKDKPFVRAAKGSIIRIATNDLYKEEIKELYANEELSQLLGKLDLDSDPEDIRQYLVKAFAASIKNYEGATDDTDVFQLGADSLDVITLATTIDKAVLSSGQDKVRISARTIYENPTVSRLTNFLLGASGRGSNDAGAAVSRTDRIMQMVDKYTSDFVNAAPLAIPSSRPSRQVVIVTGTTGSLGTDLLAQLAVSPDVERVYCLNRSADAEARQKVTLTARGFPLENLHKAKFIATDFGLDRFGLDESVYAELLASVTIFIHNAWAVDFNLSLESYEYTHIAGTRRAVDFAAAAAFKPPVLFISSIASIAAWPFARASQEPVPETIDTVLDTNLPLPQGYGESKHVAGQILARASKYLGLETAVVRCGQLGGPSEDAAFSSGAVWNRHEWLPTIINTSKALGKLPTSLGNMNTVDWVPMDKTAGTVVDLALGWTSSEVDVREDEDGFGNCRVLHISNPQIAPWEDLYPHILAYYNTSADEKKVEPVGLEEWLATLRAIEPTKENAERVPGLKLLGFYEGIYAGSGVSGASRLGTAKTEGKSETLKNLKAIDGKLIQRWMKDWAF